VINVHPDGSFDLQVSSGEIIEHVAPEWLERLKKVEDPPPSTAGSRPATGVARPASGLSRPTTGQPQLPTAASGPTKERPGLSHASANENAAPGNQSDSKPATPSVVDLDATLSGIGRKGGRGNLGALRAARSEMPSLLSWS